MKYGGLRQKAFDALAGLLAGTDEEMVFSVGALFEENKAKKDAPYDGTQLLLEFMLSAVSDLLRLSSGIETGVANSDLRDGMRALLARTSRARLRLRRAVPAAG